MKICYLADAGSVHTQRWVKYFADKGHRVDLISYRPFGHNNISNVNLHLLSIIRPSIRILTPSISLLSNICRIRRLIQNLKPDILHAYYVLDYGFLGALSRFHPLIASALGSDVLVAPKQDKIAKLTVRFALNKPDVVLSVGQYLKEYISYQFNLPSSKITVLPWGIDLNIFTTGYHFETQSLRACLGITDCNFVILSPRHLSEHYRIENIVKAMPLITERFPETTLVVLKGAVEDRSYESRIDTLIEQQGIGKNVRLIRRHLSTYEMAVLYNISDVFISIPRSDGFPISTQEGMACGAVPIVGNPEVYTHEGINALFVDPNDPKDIAQKVIYCIEHPELKQRFYAMNKKIIEENADWTKNAARLEELYQKLVAGKRG